MERWVTDILTKCQYNKVETREQWSHQCQPEAGSVRSDLQLSHFTLMVIHLKTRAMTPREELMYKPKKAHVLRNL